MTPFISTKYKGIYKRTLTSSNYIFLTFTKQLFLGLNPQKHTLMLFNILLNHNCSPHNSCNAKIPKYQYHVMPKYLSEIGIYNSPYPVYCSTVCMGTSKYCPLKGFFFLPSRRRVLSQHTLDNEYPH